MFPMAVRYALGVHVICATDRRLCVPTNNPMEFAVALHPYLKMAENNPIIQCSYNVVYQSWMLSSPRAQLQDVLQLK